MGVATPRQRHPRCAYCQARAGFSRRDAVSMGRRPYSSLRAATSAAGPALTDRAAVVSAALADNGTVAAAVAVGGMASWAAGAFTDLDQVLGHPAGYAAPGRRGPIVFDLRGARGGAGRHVCASGRRGALGSRGAGAPSAVAARSLPGQTARAKGPAAASDCAVPHTGTRTAAGHHRPAQDVPAHATTYSRRATGQPICATDAPGRPDRHGADGRSAGPRAGEGPQLCGPAAVGRCAHGLEPGRGCADAAGAGPAPDAGRASAH
mmetsp:Transcript_47591/g.132341  ORF Transcript_47591/g.132341 Transcript_47591/m.132341 type:complete len:264 (-) Transcript_47591:526-1317(-)